MLDLINDAAGVIVGMLDESGIDFHQTALKGFLIFRN